MQNKRIAILTLSQSEPLLLLAGVKDGKLHIVKTEQLPRSIDALKETLPAKLDKFVAGDFILLVDEVIPHFSQYGRDVRLQHVGQDQRPIVVSALEAYRNLKALGAISFPKEGAGTFDISESVIEETRDGKGRVSFNIDWSELSPLNTALLLAVHAATSTHLYDAGAAKALLKALGAKNPVSPKQRFVDMCRDIDSRFGSHDALGGDK